MGQLSPGQRVWEPRPSTGLSAVWVGLGWKALTGSRLHGRRTALPQPNPPRSSPAAADWIFSASWQSTETAWSAIPHERY